MYATIFCDFSNIDDENSTLTHLREVLRQRSKNSRASQTLSKSAVLRPEKYAAYDGNNETV